MWRCRVAGRARTIGNRVYLKRVSRVRISPSPPRETPETAWFQGFQAKSHGRFPLRFPLSEVQYVFDEGVHPGGADLLHPICDMAVNIQGKGCCSVAQVVLERLDVIAASDGSDGVGMAQIC